MQIIMAISPYFRSLKKGAAYIRSKAPGLRPRVAIVLGSGLDSSLPDLRRKKFIDYRRIPGFPKPTVTGHSGRMILGEFVRKGGNLPIAIMQGRFHFYEGSPMADITQPYRVLNELGVRTLVLTSAVGSLIPSQRPGHICVLKDHINLMGANPLRGMHTEEFGPMFPDLVNAYSPALRKLAVKECKKLKIPVREGVYLAAPGPSYETPAEIRAYRMLGGHVVGMSTVPEAIVARQCGMDLLVMSWVSNMAAGMSKTALSHPEVLALGKKMAVRLRKLQEALFKKL